MCLRRPNFVNQSNHRQKKKKSKFRSCYCENQSSTTDQPAELLPILRNRDRIHKHNEMGFLVTTLIFVVVGIIASLCARICCNRGPSTNLLHLTLVVTATVSCWMMWAIVYLAQLNPLIVPILNEAE